MKCTLVLCGILAVVAPISSQAFGQDTHSTSQICGQQIQYNPTLIPCPGGTNGICIIPLSCLQELANQKDPAAIEVNAGDIVYWISDIRNIKGKFRKFRFKKFERVLNSDNPDCSAPKSGDPETPFEDGFPDPNTQTSSLKKAAVVSIDAPYHACFKHAVQLDVDRDNEKDGDGNFDPHIMIGGPSVSSVFGVDTTSGNRLGLAQPKLGTSTDSARSTSRRH